MLVTGGSTWAPAGQRLDCRLARKHISKPSPQSARVNAELHLESVAVYRPVTDLKSPKAELEDRSVHN